jgi:hypothetical protein
MKNTLPILFPVVDVAEFEGSHGRDEFLKAIFPFFKREMRIKRLFELIEVIVRELHHDLKMGSITPSGWLFSQEK